MTEARDPWFAAPASPVFGQCFGCGAIAWELLSGVSDYCMDCDPASYRHDDEDGDDYDEAAL